MQRAASAFAALAASCTPALAYVAPWSSPDPPPLAVQFLVGIALMAVAAAVIAWQGVALARRALVRGALARERKRRRASQDLLHSAYEKAGTWRSMPLWLPSGGRSAGGRRVSAPTAGGRPSASCQCADSSRAARFQATVVSVG